MSEAAVSTFTGIGEQTLRAIKRRRKDVAVQTGGGPQANAARGKGKSSKHTPLHSTEARALDISSMAREQRFLVTLNAIRQIGTYAGDELLAGDVFDSRAFCAG